MVHAVMSYIRSVPNTRINNLVLYSIPLINLLRRHVLEEQCFPAMTSTLSDPSQLNILNAKRRVFQNDYLLGMGIQTAIAAITLAVTFRGFPFQSRNVLLASLGAFAVVSLNVATSLTYHFSAGGFGFYRTTR